MEYMIMSDDEEMTMTRATLESMMIAMYEGGYKDGHDAGSTSMYAHALNVINTIINMNMSNYQRVNELSKVLSRS